MHGRSSLYSAVLMLWTRSSHAGRESLTKQKCWANNDNAASRLLGLHSLDMAQEDFDGFDGASHEFEFEYGGAEDGTTTNPPASELQLVRTRIHKPATNSSKYGEEIQNGPEKGPVSAVGFSVCRESRDWTQIQIIVYRSNDKGGKEIAAYVDKAKKDASHPYYMNPASTWYSRCIDCRDPDYERHHGTDFCNFKAGIQGLCKLALDKLIRAGRVKENDTIENAIREISKKIAWKSENTSLTGKWRNFSQARQTGTHSGAPGYSKPGHFSATLVNVDDLKPYLGSIALPDQLRWLKCRAAKDQEVVGAPLGMGEAASDTYNIHHHVVDRSRVCDYEMEDDVFPQQNPIMGSSGCSESDMKYLVYMFYRDPNNDPRLREIAVIDSVWKSDVDSDEKIGGGDSKMKGELPGLVQLTNCQECPSGYAPLTTKCRTFVKHAMRKDNECATPLCRLQSGTRQALDEALDKLGQWSPKLSESREMKKAAAKELLRFGSGYEVAFTNVPSQEDFYDVHSYQTPGLTGTYYVTAYMVDFKLLKLPNLATEDDEVADWHKSEWIECDTAVDETKTMFAQLVQASSICDKKAVQDFASQQGETKWTKLSRTSRLPSFMRGLTWRPVARFLAPILVYVQVAEW